MVSLDIQGFFLLPGPPLLVLLAGNRCGKLACSKPGELQAINVVSVATEATAIHEEYC